VPGLRLRAGGKGANQAAAAAKAGAEVRFVGHVGDDAYGPVMRGLLEGAGVDCAGLAVSARPTAIAVIGVDDAGENSIMVGSGANLDTAAGQVPDALLGPGATVLCQNEIRSAESFAALRRARARGARAILNLAPAGPVPDEVLATSTC
jgi:ribokinase